MASSAQGGSLVFNYSSMLQRGANLADILNPSLARQNLGIASGTLTPGVGLAGPSFNASSNSSIAVNASTDGVTASTSNNFITQFDSTGGLSANTVTASNLTLGSFTNSPIIKLGGSATLQGYSGGAGNLLINSTSSGVIGLNIPAGAISMSALNGLELYPTGSKVLTAGTGTTINLYTGSVSPYALTVNGGVNSNGKLNVLGGANVDTLTATTSLTTPVANITILTSTTSTTGNASAGNVTVSSNLSASNITSNTMYVSNAIVIQTALVRANPTTISPTSILTNTGFSCQTQMLLSAPTVAQTSTTGSSINLTALASAAQALTVSGGLLCNLATGFGVASNALTVVGGLVVDSINSVFRQPALPSFTYSVVPPNGIAGQTINCPLVQWYVTTPPIGFDVSQANSGKVTFNYAGRYHLTLCVLNLSGTSNWINCNINREGYIYSLFGFNGNTITASGSYTQVFDVLIGDFFQMSTFGFCGFDRLSITAHMIS